MVLNAVKTQKNKLLIFNVIQNKMTLLLDSSRKRAIFEVTKRLAMNQLPIEKRTQIISMLVEGTSIRAITRITGCSKNTIAKLLGDVGRACMKFHNEKVTGVSSQRIQADETWTFIGKKEKRASVEDKEKGLGDCWTWVALDADSKLAVSWFVGDRTLESARTFMQDVASRLVNRVQLTTDGHKAYLQAVNEAFTGEIDYAQLVKIYGTPCGEHENERKYSPAECTGAKKTNISGTPEHKHVSTSYVERSNLTMRMHMRRFTRLTNAFSKKLENHIYAVALHFVYYNFCRIHQTLRVTPAMEAGLTKDLMEISDIVKLVDKYDANQGVAAGL
jgi:IS1 family transposase